MFSIQIFSAVFVIINWQMHVYIYMYITSIYNYISKTKCVCVCVFMYVCVRTKLNANNKGLTAVCTAASPCRLATARAFESKSPM